MILGFIRKISFFIIVLLIASCATKSVFSPRKAKPPKTVFKSLQKEIELGDSVAITWYVENADSILFEGSSCKLSSSDTIYFSPDTTTTYMLLTYRAGERVKKRKQEIKVVTPEISQFEVTDTVTDEKDITVIWRARNAKYVSISYLGDSLKYYGKEILRRDTTTVFKIKAFGKFNVDSAQKQTVVKLIEESELPDKVHHGQLVTALWKYKRADSIKISGFDTVFNPVDTFTFIPDETVEYIISIFRNYGVRDEVTWPLAVLPPKIAYFGGSRIILRGEVGMLSWSVLGGDSIKINNSGDNLSARGRKFVFPTRDSIFTLNVYDKQFTISKPFEVKVLDKRAYVKDTLFFGDLNPTERIDMDFFSHSYIREDNKIEHALLLVDTSGNYLSGVLPPRSKERELKKIIKKVWEPDFKKGISDYEMIEVTPDISPDYHIAFCVENRAYNIEMLESIKLGLTKFALEKQQDDVVSLFTYGKKIERRLEKQKDERKILREVEYIGTNSFETPLLSALSETIKAIGSNKEKKNVIVLFTSSNDNSSIYHADNLALAQEKLARDISRLKIPVFVITLGNNLNINFLQDIVDCSGGKLYIVKNSADISGALMEINQLLHQHYLLSYLINEEFKREINIDYQNRTAQISVITKNYNALINPDFTGVRLYDTSVYWYSLFDEKPAMYFSQTFCHFNQSGDELFNEECSKKVETYASLYTQNNNFRFIIAGHSDLKGSDEQCYDVGLKRAENVKALLMQHGIPETNVKTVSFGKDNPVWDKELFDWQAEENRRVEIIVYRHYTPQERPSF